MNPWLGLVLDAVGEQFGVPFPPPNIRGPFSLDDAALLASVLEEGGLADVHVQAVETPMHAASVQAWWEKFRRLHKLEIVTRAHEGTILREVYKIAWLMRRNFVFENGSVRPVKVE